MLVATVSGCGGSSSDTSSQDGGTTTLPDGAVVSTGFPLGVTCTDDSSRWERVKPSADGFVVRRVNPQGGHQTIATIGSLCSKATNAAACTTKTEQAPTTGWDPWAGADLGPRQATPEHAVATIGDEVRILTTIEALAATLAPIDDVDEAATLLALKGYEPLCGSGATSVPAARAKGDGFELQLQTSGSCGAAVKRAIIAVNKDGMFETVSEETISKGGPTACGRRPATLAQESFVDDGSVGSLLARMAHLEAASIPAFGWLARDLERHDAPIELLQRVEQARRDEIRHARVMRAAARQRGYEPERPRIGRAAARSLFELARENATEGCVRETFGALVATHQARFAGDAELAALFADIAVDETRHASLSWDLADWLDAQLTENERAAVAAARAAAFAELAQEVRTSPSPETRALAGMPSAEAAASLLSALDAALA